MGLMEALFGYQKPKLHCHLGGQCDLIRVKVSDGKSSQQYRWQCKKCEQQFFYSDSYLNGKKITQD